MLQKSFKKKQVEQKIGVLCSIRDQKQGQLKSYETREAFIPADILVYINP